jgi:hypothetical protein
MSELGNITLNKWEMFGSLQFSHIKLFVECHAPAWLILPRDGTLAQTTVMSYRLASVPSR